MHKTFLKIFHWSWITLHSAVYLIGAGAALRFFDLLGMSLWLVFGWIMLMPTLLAPSLIAQWYHRSRNGRSDQTAHESTRVSARSAGSAQ